MRGTVFGDGAGRGGPFQVRSVRLVAVGSFMMAGVILLPACGDDGAADQQATTTRAGSGVAAGDEHGGLEAADVRMRDPLRTVGTNFPEEDFGSGTRLEYTGSAFRMVALQRPVFSPLQDRGLAGLTFAQVSVDLATVSGFGTAGLACGIDRDGSYIFGVGRDPGGDSFVAIAYYDRAAGMPESADGARGDDAIRDLVLPPVGEPVTVGAVCRPGDGPEEALLTMTLDGREVLSATGNNGRPRGQVGMFNWGAQASTDPLVTDFTNFAAAGSFR